MGTVGSVKAGQASINIFKKSWSGWPCLVLEPLSSSLSYVLLSADSSAAAPAVFYYYICPTSLQTFCQLSEMGPCRFTVEVLVSWESESSLSLIPIKLELIDTAEPLTRDGVGGASALLSFVEWNYPYSHHYQESDMKRLGEIGPLGNSDGKFYIFTY